MSRSPFLALFRINKKFELVFVNIHFQSRKSNESIKNEAQALAVLAQAMKNTIGKIEVKNFAFVFILNVEEQNHIVIFGSFYMKPTTSEFEPLINCHYSSVIEQNTDIHSNNLQGTDCIDNIWLSTEAKTIYTSRIDCHLNQSPTHLSSLDQSGVIRDNLSSLWIPSGWSWGGLVSNHCPIWIELDFSRYAL